MTIFHVQHSKIKILRSTKKSNQWYRFNNICLFLEWTSHSPIKLDSGITYKVLLCYYFLQQGKYQWGMHLCHLLGALLVTGLGTQNVTAVHKNSWSRFVCGSCSVFICPTVILHVHTANVFLNSKAHSRLVVHTVLSCITTEMPCYVGQTELQEWSFLVVVVYVVTAGYETLLLCSLT